MSHPPPKMKPHSRISTLFLALCLTFLFSQCSAPFLRDLFMEEPDPSVDLAYHRAVIRCKILVEDMELPVRILPRKDIPYSHQAFAGIRVGYNFPYEDFKEIMTWARNYYQEARYIMLTDPGRSSRRSVHYRLHLGVRTDEAFEEGWKAWSDEDFKRIRGISSQEDMHKLLLSFKTDPNPLPYQKEGGPWWHFGL